MPTADTVTLTRDQVASLARDAIGLYLEWLERHGCDIEPDSHEIDCASIAAVSEVVEGTFAELPTAGEVSVSPQEDLPL